MNYIVTLNYSKPKLLILTQVEYVDEQLMRITRFLWHLASFILPHYKLLYRKHRHELIPTQY